MKPRSAMLWGIVCSLLGLLVTADFVAVHPAAAPSVGGAEPTVHIQVLAINDFHGQLNPGRSLDQRPAGSAPVLTAYLRQAAAERPTILVHAGDLVGGSPPESGLLQDEPTIMWFNLLGNAFCSPQDRMNARCNLVGTVGNHEFDEGRTELLRLIHGGNAANGPFLEDPYAGAHFPYVCANVFDAVTGEPLLPAFVVKTVEGVAIGFIGAVTRATPSMVHPAGVQGLVFREEASAINEAARSLRRLGVEAIVVLLHQGGTQAPYAGPTAAAGATVLEGAVVALVKDLDDAIDVVVSGHTHEFSNALVANRHGVSILVTQAWAKGVAFGAIDLEIARDTRDVVRKSARILPAWADAGPGRSPDPEAAALLERARARTAPIIERPIAEAAAPILRRANAAGESALGSLIADAQRSALGTDFAFTNPGGIRADIEAGPVTWGELYAVQPFGNALVALELTGQQIYELLNQQWSGPAQPRLLQVSGLTYRWDGSRPPAKRVVAIRKDGRPIRPRGRYSVAVNEFLAAGGDGFTVLTQGENRRLGGDDLGALIEYIQRLPQPFAATTDGRIRRD